MNLIKCEHQHFYDSDKFDSCPHCANVTAKVKVEDLLGKNQNQIHTVILNKTTLDNSQKTARHYVTGWLVCIEGEMQGKSFPLLGGDNYIGRAPHMNVVLAQEPTVSRENHACITYCEDTNSFTLSTESDAAPVLYNHHLLKKNNSQILSAHDILTLGECRLCFVPFCGEQFHWDSPNKH